jgi:hypothetical protein
MVIAEREVFCIEKEELSRSSTHPHFPLSLLTAPLQHPFLSQVCLARLITVWSTSVLGADP